MQRYKLTIEYDGTPFAGWQLQHNALSIQGIIEEAFKQLSQESPRLHVAGRTDAGVHALGQVAHLDLSKNWDPYRLMMASNFYLKPYPIKILKVEAVSADFHARFSAKSRSYFYRILNRPAPSALDFHRVWHVPIMLDAEKMHEASQLLLGPHDFSTFRAKNCQAKSPFKSISQIKVTREGDEIRLFVEAPSFLYHQIRNIVGSLYLVGSQKWSVEDFEHAFKACDRAQGGPTSPPQGLYFYEVKY